MLSSTIPSWNRIRSFLRSPAPRIVVPGKTDFRWIVWERDNWVTRRRGRIRCRSPVQHHQIPRDDNFSLEMLRGQVAPRLILNSVDAQRGAGWHHTVNIRVRDINVWNPIAEVKILSKVRKLQADPEVGGKGLISPDTPTNIHFFIASWRQ